MGLFLPTLHDRQFLPELHDRRNSSDLAFVVWAAVILIGLAIASVALGVAAVDPAIFVSP